MRYYWRLMLMMSSLILLWATVALASDPLQINVNAGRIVSIKEQTLFMPPLGMIQLRGVRLPTEIVPGDRQRALDSLNTWVAGKAITINIHQVIKDTQLIELLDATNNYNFRLIRDGLAVAEKGYAFSPPLAGGSQMTTASGAVITVNPSGAPMYADETVSSNAVVPRDVSASKYLVEVQPSVREYKYDPQAARSTQPLPAVELINDKTTTTTTPAEPVQVTQIRVDPVASTETSYAVEPKSSAPTPTATAVPPQREETPAPSSATSTKPASPLGSGEISDQYVPTRSTSTDKTQVAQEHYERGRNYHQANQFDLARQEYILALESNPYHPDAAYHLSRLYVDKKAVENSHAFATDHDKRQSSTELAASIAPPKPVPVDTTTTPPATNRPVIEITPSPSSSTPPTNTTPGPATVHMSKKELMNTFDQMFREDDLVGMKRLVREYQTEMREFFESLREVLSQNLEKEQARPLKKQTEIIARLFSTEHDDDSLLKKLAKD